jgi:hypothetical protein
MRVRREQVADDGLVVVRGGRLDPDVIRFDAVEAHRRFGQYGVSVFAAGDQDEFDALSRDRLSRFGILTVMMAGTIRAAGLELRPTFRSPHYTIMLPDLDADLSRLLACENEIRVNPFFRAPEE